MKNLSILSTIYLHHHHVWQCAGISFGKLEAIVSQCVSNVPKGRHYSAKADLKAALTDPKNACSWVEHAFEEPRLVNALADLLGNRDVFSANSEEKIRSYIFGELAETASAKCSKTTIHPCLEILTPEDFHCHDDYALSKQETDVLTRLNTGIRTGIRKATANLLVWRQSGFSGGNFISSLLNPTSFGREIKIIALLSPIDPQDNYYDGMKALTHFLGIGFDEIDKDQKVLKALQENAILVVAKHAEYMPKIPKKIELRSPFGNLVLLASRLGGSLRPLILFVGDAPMYGVNRHGYEEIDILSSDLEIPQKDRFGFFLEQSKRFDDLRGSEHIYGSGGFRTKRARWQLDSRASFDRYPIDIRIRAFFASNQENLSYSDPTCGFRNLCGGLFADPPFEVREYIRASYLLVESFSRGVNQQELQILRWISTGLYWLSNTMLKELQTGKLGGTKKIGNAKLEDRLQYLQGLGIIKDTPGSPNHQGDKPERYYQMSLGLRAYVQEQWRVDAPFSRSVAHYSIAKRLYDAQNERRLLLDEFPFRPHWGRTRHYFLAEAIRHLVRASEIPDHQIMRPITKMGADPFPDPPEAMQRPGLGAPGGACDPFYTQEYCYSVLFHVALNRNTTGQTSRALSKRHGAYYMTAELLQLLGDHSKVINVSPYFPQKNHGQYYSELAYAYLDLGNIEAARIAFQKAKAVATDEAKTRADLNIALLETVVGGQQNLKKAEQILQTAIKKEAFDPHDFDLKSKRLNGRQKGIITRTAHLSYMKGDMEDAISLYRAMGLENLQSDAAHCYIAALHRLRTDQSQDEAFAFCLSRVFLNTSEGNQHEALGFRITMSHTLRAMGMLRSAEKNLTKVQHDIIHFGCSERTFLNFLLEAGRTLIVQKRYARAYVIYLLPGYLRSKSRGMVYLSEKLQTYSLAALQGLEGESTEFTSEGDWQEKISEEIEDERLQAEKAGVNERQGLPIDPLASFEFSNSEIPVKILSLKTVFTERSRFGPSVSQNVPF